MCIIFLFFLFKTINEKETNDWHFVRKNWHLLIIYIFILILLKLFLFYNANIYFLLVMFGGY